MLDWQKRSSRNGKPRGSRKGRLNKGHMRSVPDSPNSSDFGWIAKVYFFAGEDPAFSASIVR
jgi:hypothetical protein